MNDTWAMRPSATTLTTTSTTRPNLPTPPYLGPNSAVQGRSSRSASPAPSVHYPNPVFQWVRGELIGKGSYGRVYLGMNATTGAIMAVKQVEKPTTRSDQVDKRQIEVIQALKEESATLQDLDHENIVQYLGFEESATNLSIFLEYVPGGTIGSCLQNRGQAFSEGVTKSFGYQILLGIEYLHSRGILHRDLKSENILVEPIGVCKISDFGISKRLSSQDAEERAFTELRGTLFWMAPEVVNSRERGYDTKIDIWSVGCVMLEMWTGKRPWQGEQPIPVMMKLYRDKVAPPLPKGCSLSPAGEDFRLKCFTVDPQFRPSASELLTHSYLIPQKGWVFHRSEIESAPVQVTTSAEVLNRGHRPTSSYDDIATPTQGPGPVDSRWDFRRPSEVGSSSTLTIQIPARSSSAAPATRHQPPDPRHDEAPRRPSGPAPPLVTITPPGSPNSRRHSQRPASNSRHEPSRASFSSGISPGSGSRSQSGRLKTKRSFYVANPDDPENTIRPNEFKWNPPPLPTTPQHRSHSRSISSASTHLSPETPMTARPGDFPPLANRRMVSTSDLRESNNSLYGASPAFAASADHLLQSGAGDSTWQVGGSGWATSTSTSTVRQPRVANATEDDETGSDSESDSDSMWAVPPRQPNGNNGVNGSKHRTRMSIFQKRQSILPRPDLEEVYDKLDQCFPDVNVDAPIVAPDPDHKYDRKKSIRMVAQELVRKQDRLSRRGTKMWGARAQELQALRRSDL